MKNMLQRLIPIILIAFFLSCQDQIQDYRNNNINEDNYATTKEAFLVADAQSPVSNAHAGRVSKPKIKSIFSFSPDNDVATMHIINYEGNGFIIVSGDKRITPVLAYSDDSTFPTDGQLIPAGLSLWLQEIHDGVSNIRKGKQKQSNRVKKQWDEFSSKNVYGFRSISASARIDSMITIGDCNNGDSGYTSYVQVNPLLSTRWNQGDPYNDALPYGNCNI